MPDLTPVIPEIFLLTMACVVLVVDLFLKPEQRNVMFWLTELTLLGLFFLTWQGMQAAEVTTFGGSFIRDSLSDLLKVFTYVVTAGVLLYSRDYLKDRDLFKGEYYVLALFSLLGMMIMISAGSFLTLYMGLELLSLSLYALVAFNRDSGEASEAAIKYFVLGAIASGMLLYGMSILYGLTGTLDIATVQQRLLASPQGGEMSVLFGMVFVLVGLAFKLGAVPFHMWVPDVYQGAPTSVTAFIGSAPKLAGFAMLIRLMVEGMGSLQENWGQILMILGVLSLAVGNIVAIAQTNIKRMLAYSTISHVGFIVLGVMTGTQEGYSAALFYTLIYAVMSLGAFGVVIVLSRKGFEADQLDHYKGLNDSRTWLAFLMLILMASMIGIPGTAGFVAKLWVLEALISQGHISLAVYAVLMSVIGAFYYLRVIKLMYIDKPGEGETSGGNAVDTGVVLSLNSLSLVALGLFPGVLMAACIAVFAV
jgi:NADH-quinone oxidoreductase subunit N